MPHKDLLTRDALAGLNHLLAAFGIEQPDMAILTDIHDAELIRQPCVNGAAVAVLDLLVQAAVIASP